MEKNEKHFTQVCVWPGTLLNDGGPEEFEKFFKENFKGTRIKFIEVIKTLPDKDSFGIIIKDTGNRSDIFFYVHDDDVSKFSVQRLNYGIRWIEDVLANDNYKQRIYPDRVFNYVTWNKKYIKFPKDEKPKCKLSGIDGNVFNIIATVSKSLQRAKLNEKATEFQKKAITSKSYDDVLILCNDYVEIE